MQKVFRSRSCYRGKSRSLSIVVLWVLISCSASGEPSSAETIAERLNKGIVLDVSQVTEGMPVKMLYEPEQFDAIKEAGFQSIRIYVVAMRNPAEYRTVIEDALDRGLAVVISLWGNSEWVSKPLEGIEEFVEVWNRFAFYYKEYPEDLVFDLWNEPAGLIVSNGEPQGIDDAETVMMYLNAAIPVIRKSNPDRVLGIGGPGLNGCRELEQYVTPQYLTYKLEDSTGFEEDANLIGLFHMYHPSSFTHWISDLDQFPGWENEVREQLSYPVAWAEKWQKPVLLSEWGAWAPPSRSTDDFEAYLRFVVEECAKYNINWIYYSAGFNNQWAFNILNTDQGWNQDALDILTGITAPTDPPLSPIINATFGWATDFWMTKGSANTFVAWNANLGGPSALRVEATKSYNAEVYQQTPAGQGSPPNRYLISMTQSKLYKISFLARSLNGTGIMRVRLSDVAGSEDGFWTSDPLAISSQINEYTIGYIHHAEDIGNVRLAFLFHEKDQVILLDQVALRGYPDTLGYISTPSAINYRISGLQDGAIFIVDQEILIDVDAYSGKGAIASIGLFLNNDSIAGTGDPSLSYAYTPAPAAEGWNEFKVHIRDDVGNFINEAFPVYFINHLPNAMPLIEITSPQDSSIIQYGSEDILAIEASDPDGNISSVKVYLNGNLTFTFRSAPYSIGLNRMSIGDFDLVAEAMDDRGGTAADSIFISITDSTVSSVQQLKSVALIVYPNPVKHTLYFGKKCDYAICTLQGTRLLEGRGAMHADVSSLSQGMYIVKTNHGVSKLRKE